MGSTTDQGRVIATWLVIGGVVAIVVGVICGAVIEPYLYSIAAVALIDFALAWAFASGRIGPTAQRRDAAEAAGTAAQEAELDPSFNPYARED
jgi:undecaprenyl pyrophosphate phosphatase UppP